MVGKAALVSVMSGREVDDLRKRAGITGALYVGNHGVEYLDGARLEVVPGVGEHHDLIERLLAHIRRTVQDSGLVFQDKRYSASVHFRLSKDHEKARQAIEEATAASPDAAALEIFWGKQVLEIRAPLGVNKGYAMRKLVAEYRLDAAMFLGDDITDLDAIMAVREMSGRHGFTGLGVAVAHHDSPAAVLDGSDCVLNGVDEVDAFLEWLAGVLGGGRRAASVSCCRSGRPPYRPPTAVIYWTVIVPVMPPCSSQAYGNVPATSNLNWNELPCPRVPLLHLTDDAAVAVDVCGALSSFVHFIVVPLPIVMLGSAKFAIDTSVVPPPTMGAGVGVAP